MEKILIPAEAMSIHEVQSLYTMYENLTDEFWIVYQENFANKKIISELVELQQDIKKMEQDSSNLMHRTKIQKEKLNNVFNKEGLIVAGKAYRNVWVQHKSILKQVLKM